MNVSPERFIRLLKGLSFYLWLLSRNQSTREEIGCESQREIEEQEQSRIHPCLLFWRGIQINTAGEASLVGRSFSCLTFFLIHVRGGKREIKKKKKLRATPIIP